MSTATFTLTMTFTTVDCPNCGLTFAITKDFDNRRRDDHRTFYCPMGHSMSYNGPSSTPPVGSMNTPDADLTVMGISGELMILRPEDKLVVRAPGMTQEIANHFDANLTERLGKGRCVLLSDLFDVTVVPPGAKVTLRVHGLTEEIVYRLEPVLEKIFGKDGFIILSADMIDVEVEPEGDVP